MSQEENKINNSPKRNLKHSCIIILIIIVLLVIKASFYFIGPLKVQVIDAKTDKPIPNVKVEYRISGNVQPCISPGGCMGWGDDRHNGFTNSDGVFSIPLSISLRIPFIQTLDAQRKIVLNNWGDSENKNYDYYEQEFTWFPFRSFKFSLVPIPKTLDDCRDNLTEKEQYRCVKMLADRDAREINKLKFNFDYGSMSDYFLSKYLHILKNRCEGTQNLPSTNRDFACDAVLAAIKQDKNMCNNDRYCFYSVAIDLRDKSWCKNLPTEKDIKDIYDISQEKCEYIIDALTAKDK